MSRTEAMLSYLPDYIRNDQVIKSIMAAEGKEIGDLNKKGNDIFAQFFVWTATWGLCYWEEKCGLPIEPPLPYADRRAKILASLRGAENCTLGTVRQVVKAFTGIEPSCYETDLFRAGISTVGEPVYHQDYPFTIRRKFVFTAGFSAAGDEVWSADYASTLMLNVTQFFRAGMSAAGDQVFYLDLDSIYLQGGSLVDKNALRTALRKIMPARMQLIVN